MTALRSACIWDNDPLVSCSFSISTILSISFCWFGALGIAFLYPFIILLRSSFVMVGSSSAARRALSLYEAGFPPLFCIPLNSLCSISSAAKLLSLIGAHQFFLKYHFVMSYILLQSLVDQSLNRLAQIFLVKLAYPQGYIETFDHLL